MTGRACHNSRQRKKMRFRGAVRGAGVPVRCNPAREAAYIFPIMKQTILETREQLILLALLRLGPDQAYGVSIRRCITEVTGRALALTTLYATLERLERRGLVRAWSTEPLAERGGRSRRCFALEEEGRAALADTRRVLGEMSTGVEAHLEPSRSSR